MGEIDDVQHAVDQRQRDRHQRVDRAGEQAVDDGGKNDIGREHELSQRYNPLSRNRERGADPYAGIGKIGLASANSAGKITLMSPSCTCVLTGAAPVFWPLTNFVGP